MYELKIKDFILEHDDWEELLTTEPYCLKVSRDNGYVLFKYDQIRSDFSIPLVREARGIIFSENNWECVCRAFDKFGNYGESYVPEIDWDSVQVQEKCDGSLCKVWYHKEWHLSTNSTIDAWKAPTGDALYPTFGDLFERALEEYGYDNFYSFCDTLGIYDTYMFELATEKNRVVIPYKGYHIYYLGQRNLKTMQEYLRRTGFLELDLPKIYKMKTLTDIQTAASELPWDEEGYVCVDRNFNRCKIKSPAYVLAHHARTNGCITNNRLIEVVLKNEVKEFCIYCSEYRDKIEEIQSAMIECEWAAHFATCRYCGMNTKKEMALAMKEDNVPDWVQGFCFKNFEMTTSWADYINGWNSHKWERILKLNNSDEACIKTIDT